MKRAQKLDRLWAALPPLAVLVYAFLLANPHYDLNDDVILMRAFGGLIGGVYESVTPFTNPLLAWPLHGLSLLFPGVAWYSVVQLMLLYGGMYLIVLGALRAARGAGLPAALGWLAGALFVAAYAAQAAVNVVFTVTAAVLGAAAVWRLLALDVQSPRLWRGMLGAFAPLMLSYSLRTASVLPALAVWLGGCLCLWLIRRAPLKALLRGVGACALALLVLAGAREAQVRLSGEAQQIAWQDSSVNAIDYGGLAVADGDALAAAGWSPAMRDLVQNWCFLDASVTTEAFAQIPPDLSGRTLEGARAVLDRSLRRSPLMRAQLYALAGLCALAALGALLGPKGRRLWPFLAALGVGAAAGCMLLYLAWQGRLPARAGMTVLLPAHAAAAWLCLHAAGTLGGPMRREWARSAACAACALALLAAAAPCARESVALTYNPNGMDRGEDRYARLERYALQNGDELFIAQLSFGESRRLFPDWSAGKPDNLLLDWGGWNNHSAGYRAAFERFGYAHDAFCIADFVDGPVRLVTAAGEEPFAALMACMREQTGAPVRAVVETQGDGFWVYRFESGT